jgi:hypothetical protein
MNPENAMFAVYPKKHQTDAAVDELLANGFASQLRFTGALDSSWAVPEKKHRQSRRAA